MLFLYTFSFNLFAQEVCDAHKLPERKAPFFLYGLDIDQNKIDDQIEFQVAVSHHVTCQKDNTQYKQIELLKQYKNETEVLKKAAVADPKKIIELDKTLKDIDEQLSKLTKKHDGLLSKLTLACKIPASFTLVLNKEMTECLNLLKQQLEFEIKQYPFNQVPPTGADAAMKKAINDSNTINKTKYNSAISDLSMVETLLGKDELEKSPSSSALLKNQLRESDFFGANTNILIDILDTKSAEIAIFRQKIKVLERNSRVLISKIYSSENCKFIELYEKKEGLTGWFAEQNDADKKQYEEMTEYEKRSCKLVGNLNVKLNKTLELSYEDSWFENKNIENDIKDIESLLNKLNELQTKNLGNTAQRINFLNHANQYFSKYNGTGRFNIGLGAALFNSPDISNPIDSALDLSQFTAGTLEPQFIEHKLNIPSGKTVSPVIVGTMPWVDVTLALPSYSKSSVYTSSIFTWGLPLEGEQNQHAFLSQTTIEANYKIDYDVNITLKVFSLFQDICPYYCNRLNNATREKNIEFAVGLGTTDIKLTKTFTTDIREQIDLNGGYSQLASLYPLNTEETIDHSMRYWYVGGHYYMADQIRLEAYWKRYRSDYKDGSIQLDSKSSWGMSISYLFF
jgi:hypothetical protein